MTDTVLAWRKASFSDQQGSDCLEVAELPAGRLAVRDSKHPDGPILTFTTSVWSAFVRGVRAGEFD